MSVVTYQCTLTGAGDALADLTLPLASLRVTHRVGSASSYSLVVPSTAYAAGIAARPNGVLVVEVLADAHAVELMHGPLADVRADLGGGSESLTLSGAASQADPPEATRALEGVSYRGSTDTGEIRIRARPVAALRPGDTVTWDGNAWLVDTVVWTARASAGSLQEQMELSLTDPPA